MGREFGDCGGSVDEARANGCVFDYLSYEWVQPPAAGAVPESHRSAVVQILFGRPVLRIHSRGAVLACLP